MTAAQTIAAIVGVWYIDGMPFDEDGILVIREDGRLVQFPTSITKPRLNQTMRLWHSEFTGESIRFRPSPRASGWYRKIEDLSDGWDMIAELDGKTSRFHCTSADLATLPLWYSEMLDKNLSRMDELQREQQDAEQDVDPNA